MTQRMKLADVLGGADRESLARQFADTKAAGDLAPIPAGTYRCRLASGQLTKSRSGTPSFEMVFTVDEGEYQGRRVWHHAWLTPAAMPQAKRDLARLGIATLEQCEQPLPACFACDVKVVLRTDDDGTQRNGVRAFVVTGTITDPTADPDFGRVAT